MTAPDRAKPWWTDRLLILVGLLLVVWTMVALTWPLSGDAGVFSWMADTVLRGDAPYIDAWDTKGPGAWLPSLLVQSVLGRTSWGIRIFDLLTVLATLAALRSVARSLKLSGDGRVAIALYVVWYTSLDHWHSAQPDGWVGSWLIVACAAALRPGIFGAFVAGALVAIAMLVKPFYLGYALVVWLLIWTNTPAFKGRRLVGIACSLLGGIVTLAVVLQLLRVWGGLDGFWDAQRWNRVVYAGFGGPWLTRIPTTISGVLQLPWGIAAPIALFGALLPQSRRSLGVVSVSIGFLGAVAGVMLQGKGWTYHWLPMLPFLALLADVGFSALTSEALETRIALFRRTALAVALCVPALAPAQQLYRLLRSRANETARATYEQREFRYYGRQPGSVYDIVDSLSRLEPGRANILVWAMHPAPQMLAGLRIPTRFAVIRPLFDGPGSEFRSRYRAQFERELNSSPPRWWILPTAALIKRESELEDHDVVKYRAANDFLREHYRLAGSSEEWMIYELAVKK